MIYCFGPRVKRTAVIGSVKQSDRSNFFDARDEGYIWVWKENLQQLRL